MKSRLILDHDFHPKTVAELQLLRDIRLALAKKQMMNIEDTLDQLISRKLINPTDRTQAKVELESELRDRIVMLEQRYEGEEDIHADDISLYVDLI
jgi:hypothetical protein